MKEQKGRSNDETGVRVRPLNRRETGWAGKVLAASHGDYPAFRVIFPKRGIRTRVLQLFMTATCRDAAGLGAAMVAEDDSGLLGVALWLPPGAFPLSPLRKIRMTPVLLRIAALAPRSMSTFAKVGSTLERSLPADPAWYLQVLGVHPRMQRSGIGRRLIEPVLARSNEDGIPCRLHTSDSSNVEYYRRYGFEVEQSEIRVGTNGPSYIAMSRAPE